MPYSYNSLGTIRDKLLAQMDLSIQCFLKDIFLSVSLLPFKVVSYKSESTYYCAVKGLHNNAQHNTTLLLMHPCNFYPNTRNSKMELHSIQPPFTFSFQEDIIIKHMHTKHMLDTSWDCIDDHKPKKNVTTTSHQKKWKLGNLNWFE